MFLKVVVAVFPLHAPPAPILGLRTAQSFVIGQLLILALTSERMAMMTSPYFQNKSQIHLWHSYAVTQKKTTNQVGIFCYAS